MSKKYWFFILAAALVCLFFIWLDFRLHAREKPKYQLAIVAIFQNDAPYLREWIEYHNMLGVDHFLLMNNLSNDNYQEVLQPYIKTGLVELVNWPEHYETLAEWNREQCTAYECAIKRLRGQAGWVALIDTDEYICPVIDDTLLIALERYKDQVGIAVNWQCFGTSGVKKIPEDKLMTEMLIMTAEDDFLFNRQIKTIVRPEYVVSCDNPHFVNYRKGYSQVTPEGVAFQGAYSPYVSHDILQINHYVFRDEDSLVNHKIPRWERWGRDIQKIREEVDALNQKVDDKIMRFVPALRARLGLMAASK